MHIFSLKCFSFLKIDQNLTFFHTNAPHKAFFEMAKCIPIRTVYGGSTQGAPWSGKSQGNLFFLQGQGKVREFCKMVMEIRKSSKVREF